MALHLKGMTLCHRSDDGKVNVVELFHFIVDLFVDNAQYLYTHAQHFIVDLFVYDLDIYTFIHAAPVSFGKTSIYIFHSPPRRILIVLSNLKFIFPPSLNNNFHYNPYQC